MGSHRRATVALSVLAMLVVPADASAADTRSEPGRLLLDRDRVTDTPRFLARRDGFLTPRSHARPIAVALDYVRRKEAAFALDRDDLARLDLVRAYRSGSGAVHLRWAQTYRGIPAFGPGLSANVDAEGRLINVGGGPRPDLAVESVEPLLSPLEALRAAARDAGRALVPGLPRGGDGPERRITFTRGHRASLTLFPGADRVRLAWRVLLRADAMHVYDAVVDARSGETLYRHNLVRQASGLAFDNYPGAPAGGSQQVKSFPGPWLTSTTRLIGTNAHVYADPTDAIDGLGFDPAPSGSNEIPPSGSGNWSYAHQVDPSPATGQDCPPTPGCSWSNFDTGFSWTINRNQAGTQLFYFVNHYHDHLRDASGIGFNQSSGNFEGDDIVQAQVDDGADTDPVYAGFPSCDYINNASVMPVPDGEPLVMQIYLWSSACSATPPGSQVYEVNAADDALIVYHEYTHGLTNRLVTDAAGYGALTGPQSAAMDEGFADWFALDLLNAQGFEPDTPVPGELRSGRYENDPIRSQPFDCPVGTTAAECPGAGSAGQGGYTYGDFARIIDQAEPHADGEIWVETLWDLRARLVADHGFGDGVNRARALITDGLRLAPANPSFLDMRNAILQADTNRRFGDRDRIWAVFAARGMGLNASTSGDYDISPVEDFTAPPPLPPEPSPTTSDTGAPSISGFSMSRRRFRVGRGRTARVSRRTPRGTTFRFRLSEQATARIAIARARPGRVVGRRCRRPTRRLRRHRRCTRYVGVGTLVRRDLPAGPRRVGFTGRIGRRALRRGGHRATISATDQAGNRSRGRRLKFTIVRR